MAKNKTTETDLSVTDYLANIKVDARRDDITKLVEMISAHTGYQPRMWGTGIVGFGSYHYKYPSGHEGDAPLAAMASRAHAIVVYLLAKFEGRADLERLGKFKTEKGCIYIKKLEDINPQVLLKIIDHQIDHIKKIYHK